MRKWLKHKRSTYYVNAKCVNCGVYSGYRVPKGMPMGYVYTDMACKRCGYGPSGLIPSDWVSLYSKSDVMALLNTNQRIVQGKKTEFTNE